MASLVRRPASRCVCVDADWVHMARTIYDWVVEERAVVVSIGAELEDALLAAILED